MMLNHIDLEWGRRMWRPVGPTTHIKDKFAYRNSCAYWSQDGINIFVEGCGPGSSNPSSQITMISFPNASWLWVNIYYNANFNNCSCFLFSLVLRDLNVIKLHLVVGEDFLVVAWGGFLGDRSRLPFYFNALFFPFGWLIPSGEVFAPLVAFVPFGRSSHTTCNSMTIFGFSMTGQESTSTFENPLTSSIDVQRGIVSHPLICSTSPLPCQST